ncbi:hypothetical protein [Undibacterium rugosum]|uniref:Uncharacterized protein n=1 Tax=Undibacterium rugosum TaxID=2762291 RepID=A0A923I5C2_9BURK|nr:hypothetical protein [Undibacterium rugosum]MBC3935831.1 hypothetical protein [Undibacterium rugosum]MBR7779387.1 hypothetical protein [Undibacterium rugosum]
MFASIYDKTDKGRQEIATRQFQLPNRLRTLLVMVDGKQSAADLLRKVQPLGLDENSVQELIDGDFISPMEIVAPVNEVAETAPNANPDISTETSYLSDSSIPELSGPEQFHAVYRFFNDTIKANLGFRGFALQLKVERASNLGDFEQLRIPFLEAVMKAKGRDFARNLRDQLDVLLYQGRQVQGRTALDED